MGIARTGSPGGHYSGKPVLAFSVANPIDVPPSGAHQPASFSIDTLNDTHCDLRHTAAVQAIEEAIINAMVAVVTLPVVYPAGH